MSEVQDIYAILLGRHYQRELFSDLGRQEKDGSRYVRALCPFCQEGAGGGERGHFSYSLEKPLWRCFACEKEKQTSGDWIGYLEARRGLDFKEALLYLAEKAGVELKSLEYDRDKHKANQKKAELLEAAQAVWTRALYQDERAAPVLAYLRERGYADEEIKEMELGAYVDRHGLQGELLKSGYTEQEIRDSGLLSRGFGDDYTLTLLWRDAAGRPIGIVGRSTLGEEELKDRGLHKYSYSTGLQKDKGLLGLTSVRGAKEVVLVEGVLDALYLNSRGFKVVAVGGTSLSLEQVKALEQNGTNELLLCLDSDAPGRAATERAIQVLKHSRLRAYVVSLPAGYKDADELVRKESIYSFKVACESAERASSWLARHIVMKQDITTPRGIDKALEAAFEVYTEIDDPLERKAFVSSLQESTGLSEDELTPRLQAASRKASRVKATQVLQESLSRIQQRISDGDLLGAETELSYGLDELRKSRGVQVPEPYLLQDLEHDVSTIGEGLLTGYSSLDTHIRIPQGQLTIVAGRTGHGKTTFMLNMLLNMAEQYKDKSFYFFSYEEARSRLALKLIMISSGVVISKERNFGAYINYFKEGRDSIAEIEEAAGLYNTLTESGRLYLTDKALAAEDLASVIAFGCKRNQVGAVFVDYIQKVSPRQQSSQASQRYLEVKKASQLLLEQAIQQEVAIILGAQLNRASTQTVDKKPRLEGLRESGDLEQDANLVLGLYNKVREETDEQGMSGNSQEQTLEVLILKNRQGQSNVSARLTFDPPRLRIKDAERGHWDK